jgi:hypothetical protein
MTRQLAIVALPVHRVAVGGFGAREKRSSFQVSPAVPNLRPPIALASKAVRLKRRNCTASPPRRILGRYGQHGEF